MASRLTPVTIENARIAFRNFSGEPDKFNAKGGDRNFSVLLDSDVATDLIADGYNVKQLKPREEGDQPQDYIKVKVHFGGGGKPPRIVMITHRGRSTLGENEVNILDWAEIKNVDLIFRPYEWDINGKSGVTAYLQTIFVEIVEDELDIKYADIPENM